MKSANGGARATQARLEDDVEDVLAGFDACLAERTAVSMSRELELAAMTPAELRGQVESLRCLLDRFSFVVAAAHADACVARDFVEQFDLMFISRDHDWRGVFRALVAAGDGGGNYLLVALARYRQYLESRASLVQKLLIDQGQLAETAEMQPVRPTVPRLQRLPRHRPVRVPLVYRGELALWLAGHRFALRDGLPPLLSDPTAENVWPLQRCALLVGRHTESDIVVDARLEQVSRAHAVVEWDGSTAVMVTDLSSGGTYIEQSVTH